MKKMLIHIGYPKTATTTIQESLFVKLHEAGEINYLGKADYSSNYYFNQAYDLHRSFLLSKSFNVDELKISSKKTNVISDEYFTIAPCFLEAELGIKGVDPFKYPQRLSTLFKNAVDSIEIMVTIRNQKDSIYSYYVEHYKDFLDDKSNDTPTKFIFENGKRKTLRKERLKIYSFLDLLEKYEECFGKGNIRILLFEDLKYDPKFFCDQLSQIINVESSLVETLLTGKHLREKKKSKTGYYAEVMKTKALGKIVKKLQKNDLVYKIISSYKKRYGKNSKMLNAIRKLMYKEDSFFIPKLSEEEQNIIFQEFRESNLKLSEKYNIDQEKLKKYGYI